MSKVLIIQNLVNNVISMDEALQALGVSERTLYRYKRTYLDEGPSGFIHGLQGKRSNNTNNKRNGIKHYAQKKKYNGFGPTLLSESLEQELGYTIPIETLRRKMTQRGLWVPKKPRPKKRRPRRRRKGYGLMLQFDGSYHDRLENGLVRCLLIAVDDATGKVCHASFTDSENINDVIEFRTTYFHKHGKPSSIYLDRHATYKVNHGGDQFTREMLTRFQQAMQRLGVQVIYSYSPQGKGRVERAFKTFQDRGIKMMRLAQITDYDQAQDYLQTVIVPTFNKKFSVEAYVEGDFHVPLTEDEAQQLEWSFGKRSARKLNRIGVVRYDNNRYLISEGQTLENGTCITVMHSHLGNIQFLSGETILCFEQMNY